ncbi:MAG: hypothetical protein ACLRQ0_09445 [Monoglobales bacterium]
MPNYTTMPTGRPEGVPPMEDDSGAYYYKYSYSWTSKSASTEVNLVDAELKKDSSKNNHGYIFLSCMGTTSSPPEFGLFAPYNRNGIWYPYVREAGSTSINWDPTKPIIIPESSSGGIYKYKNPTNTADDNDDAKVTIKITLSGTSIKGQIWRGDARLFEDTVPGASASIGENASANTFLLGASFPPVPETTSPGNRDAYLKHVYLQNGLLYSGTNYTGAATAWVPDANNAATYYGLLCRPEYISYNRFGATDEEISIDYT